MAVMKLPACEKCRGTLSAEREFVGLVGSIIVVKCVNCGWRMQPEAIEELVNKAKGVLRIKPAKEKVADMSKHPVRVCAECDEEKRIIGRGLCGGCYQRLKKNGTMDESYPARKSNNPTRVCNECDREMMIIGRGLCSSCLNRLKTDGTLDEKYPLTGKRAANKKRESAVPDNPSPAPVPAVITKEPVIMDTVVTVEFGDRDLDRFRDIVEAAKFNRRSLSDEILFRLDRAEEAA